ncbi:MAG: metal ABC transporter permease [Synergistaceae bacterium]|nr:metal ABC transporter permease [Synergistaceae bacterium]MBQ6738441.1 metal ABC transporter permease [Synergistaceae bacterium]MBR0075833.1 metal ABC transporter permease [Synergistaceae bacterium]MBR0079881.1 metal ABC transporter permease [Synergistaceae bacterium]MBR0233077.1 metal ABC transporter permease [Synergistaceae bacterium]
MNEILEILSYPFVIRALISGSLISICASILGVILVLKHYSLIGHGLSEIGFASLSISSALKISPMIISVPSVIAASFLIMLTKAGDTAIAVASSAALSLGIIISSLTNSISNTSSFLFGSVLAVNEADLIFSVILSFVIIILFVIFYNRLFLITYNEDYARSLGINTAFYQIMISLLTALIVVSGMRIMGTLLISGVIILPAVSAKNLASGFKALIIISGVISILAFLTGLIISFIFNIPTGAGIILTNTIILILTRAIKTK